MAGSRFQYEAAPRALDANGDPVSGAKLYIFAEASTTAVTSYSDINLAFANANPVVSDDKGFYPQIYMPNGSYKIREMTADDVLIREVDYIAQGIDSVFTTTTVQAVVDGSTYSYDGSATTVAADDVVECKEDGLQLKVASAAAVDHNLQSASGVKFYLVQDAVTFETRAAMLADTDTWHYQGLTLVTTADNETYTVAASDATDNALATAGGTKIYIAGQNRNVSAADQDIAKATVAATNGEQTILNDWTTSSEISAPFYIRGNQKRFTLPENMVEEMVNAASQSALDDLAGNRFGQLWENLRLDASGIDGTVSTKKSIIHAMPFHGRLRNVDINNIDGSYIDAGIKFVTENPAGFSVTSGNQLWCSAFECRVEASSNADYLYYFGENNGQTKMTDVQINYSTGATAKTGIYIGAGQGSNISFVRLNAVDHGVIKSRVGRDNEFGIIIDNYGAGHDGAVTTFYGYTEGRRTTSYRGSIYIGNMSESDGAAGDTGFTYVHRRFNGAGSSDTNQTLTIIGEQGLNRAGEFIYGFEFGNQDYDELTGVIAGNSFSGPGSSEEITRVVDSMRSPYLLTVNNTNGKLTQREHYNDYGNINQFGPVGSPCVSIDWKNVKFGIATATATTFARLTTAAVPISLSFEVWVNLNNPDRGHVSRSRRWTFNLQKDTSGVDATHGTISTSADPSDANDTRSDNSSERNIAAPTFGLSISGNNVDFQITAAVGGSEGDTTYDCTYWIKALGVGNHSSLQLTPQ